MNKESMIVFYETNCIELSNLNSQLWLFMIWIEFPAFRITRNFPKSQTVLVFLMEWANVLFPIAQNYQTCININSQLWLTWSESNSRLFEQQEILRSSKSPRVVTSPPPPESQQLPVFLFLPSVTRWITRLCQGTPSLRDTFHRLFQCKKSTSIRVFIPSFLVLSAEHGVPTRPYMSYREP